MLLQRLASTGSAQEKNRGFDSLFFNTPVSPMHPDTLRTDSPTLPLVHKESQKKRGGGVETEIDVKHLI